jgi:hypothetical protein
VTTRGEEKVGTRDIDEALAALDPEISTLLVATGPSLFTGRLRSLPFDTECAERLVAQASFDGLQAAAFLMKKAELIASPALRDLAWRAYLGM